ncbi:hypothetical protein CLV83_0869 [Marinobacterium mangrovicola]|uniref:Uncharacterized protein n=1 Tax=Marinobacterium mangrovicola TaxID=1476959 RepID=A0A4V2PEE2_9GAMM|nr:hypothetical protein CLV83_0869 [Marinobacterium mangrovicola]
MEKRYRRMLLKHRLIQQEEADRERLENSSGSDRTLDWSDSTRSKEMNRVRTWRQIKPIFHTIEGQQSEIHITLWDEIDN